MATDPNIDPDNSEDRDDSSTERKLRPDFEAEVRRLQQKADESRKTGRQLGLGVPNEEAAGEDLADADLLKDVQNPEESHSLYYSIQRELINSLPPGKENEELRRFVYDEKNLYLNRGKEIDASGIRGSDGRQAFLHHLRTALVNVKRWAAEGGTAYDAYMMFRDMNTAAGFRGGKSPQDSATGGVDS